MAAPWGGGRASASGPAGGGVAAPSSQSEGDAEITGGVARPKWQH